MLRFNDVMHAIASIPYIVFPFLETIWPRHAVHKSIADFKQLFDHVIAQARAEKDKTVQHGMLSLILEHGSLSEGEIRDNLVVFFLAGHDSTAGAMSSVMYYLATHPEVQAKARAQVKAILGDNDPMGTDDFKDLTYVLACIREALRLNPPFLSGVPRTCDTYFRLGQYVIPPQTSFITNIYAMQHSSTEWDDPFVFRPERHLDGSTGETKTQDEWCM
jgi:cytochrome P450